VTTQRERGEIFVGAVKFDGVKLRVCSITDGVRLKVEGVVRLGLIRKRVQQTFDLPEETARRAIKLLQMSLEYAPYLPTR